MDTEGIATGATWQETLGGKLESSPVLVPVFSPSFFASEQCGREVQAILERIRVCAAGQAATAVTPNCILPVIWVWENLAIHPTLRNIHYDNVNYPNRYRSKITGLRMLVAVHANRRRIGGERGKRLQSRRGETLERNFAHQFDTGGLDRLYVRGIENVHKKLLLQAAACNLALLMRTLHGAGKPRAAHDRMIDATLAILSFIKALRGAFELSYCEDNIRRAKGYFASEIARKSITRKSAGLYTGC